MEIVVHKNTLDKHDIKHLDARRRQKLLDLTDTAAIGLWRLSNGMVSWDECTPEFMRWLVKYYNPLEMLPLFLALRNENEIPEDVKIAAAHRDDWGKILRILRNPSNDVVNALLENAGEYILDIKKPTQKQWCIALGHAHLEYPNLIAKCPNPTVKMQKIHVRRHGRDGLDYIENPSEAVKLVAAKRDGVYALGSTKMRNPSEPVLMAAICHTYDSIDPEYFLYYIPHPNNKVMCAIRHQINMNKMVLGKLASEPKPEPAKKNIEEELDWARRACQDPIAAAEIAQNAESMQDQLNQLEKLRTKMVADLFNFKNPALAH